MNEAQVVITPRRSLALFALFSLLMVIVSYVFVLLLAAGCLYLSYLAILNLDRAPGQLLVLMIAAIFLSLTMIWSLLPRWEKFEVPGMVLERAEHPKLFAEIEQVASVLKEPLPRHVYLVWGMSAFVADRGGMLGIGNRRILAVGLPLLSVLTLSEFRAVLAHEFAHFYGGDTKLGPLVYKAQSAIGRAYQNVSRVHSASKVWAFELVNGIASLILKWHFVFFLRVINFVSRKQEFRADELACLVAGARPMEEGLKKIHGAAFAWLVYWGAEISPLLEKEVLPPIGEGFQKFLAAPNITPQFKAAIDAEIAEGKTQPFDSHPPLGERLVAIGKLPKGTATAESEIAADLLGNRREVERRFLQNIDAKFKGKTFTCINWDDLGTKVTIPGWKSLAQTNAKLLEEITAESIPEKLKQLPELARKIPDPPGQLLDWDQRTHRAKYVLSVGVGLRLLERGWRIHSQPGDFYLHCEGDQANVVEKIEALSNGEMTAEQWIEQCEKWGIVGLNLASATQEETDPVIRGA